MDTMRHQSLLTLSILLGILTTLSVSLAGERPELPSVTSEAEGELMTSVDPTKDGIYLLEQELKAYRVVRKVDLRLRVYFMKTVMTKSYQMFMTGKNGKLDTPPSFLLGGTVVRGDRLGGNKNRFFVLSAEGKWRLTSGPEIYYIQNDTKTGKRAIQTPNEDDDTPSQFVSTESTHSSMLGGE